MKKEAFYIVGISVRTTNEGWKSQEDLSALWGKFLGEGIMDQIPNKVDSAIYSVYSDYEGNWEKPYTTTIGCKVKNLDAIPKGLVGKKVSGGHYLHFEAKGNINEGSVGNAWKGIWDKDSELNRVYDTDYEVYGEKARNPEDAIVDIYVGVK